MKTNKTGEELAQKLLRSNSGATGADLLEAINKADKGSIPYWAKFIVILLVRLALVSGFIIASAMGQSIRDGYEFTSVWELLIPALSQCWFVVLGDLAWCAISYSAYAYNPKNFSIDELMSTDTWERCTRRQANFLIMSVIPIVLIFIYILC